MKLSIIVPFYNEEKTIGAVFEKLEKLRLSGWQKEIIAVDDGSVDHSPRIVQKLKIFRKRRNLGKGAAIKTGLEKVTGDYVLIQDADLEYDPLDIPQLLAEIKKSKAEVVYGSRNIKPQKRGYFLYVLGDLILTSLVNILYGTNLTDLYTGYKLFKTDLIKSIPLESKGFEFEAEVTVKILKRGIKIVEVPISYSPRTFFEGKKITLLDGLKGVFVILKNFF